VSFTQATPDQLRKVLTRAVPITVTPEVKLVIGIMYQAIFDSTLSHQSKPAKEFFYSQYGQDLCSLIGLNPTWVQELLVKHAWNPVLGQAKRSKYRRRKPNVKSSTTSPATVQS